MGVNERLKTTLSHLEHERPIDSGRVAVLMTLALSQKRFENEKRPPGMIRKLFGKKKEFVRLQVPFVSTWEGYEQLLVLWTLKHLIDIEESSFAGVFVDVTFKVFKRILQSQDYDVIFLFAHHIIPVSGNLPKPNNSAGAIEFADGGVSLERVNEFLASLHLSNKVSLIHMICKSQKLEEWGYGSLPSLMSVATAFWELPVLDSLAFVKVWIKNLNGQNSLSKAYDLAVWEIISQISSQPKEP